MTAPPPQWQPPQPAPARRGLPGWAIGLIIGGAALVFVVPVGFLFAAVYLPPALHSQISPPTPAPGDDFGGDTESDSGGDESANAGREAAARIVDTYEYYLAAVDDDSIYEIVPGGRDVDPNYIGAFLYVLTDHRSAVRFMSSPADAEQLIELAEETDELERRFLAGEDLDVDVTIQQDDGTEFRSDGKYRTIEDGSARPSE